MADNRVKIAKIRKKGEEKREKREKRREKIKREHKIYMHEYFLVAPGVGTGKRFMHES